MRERTLLLAGWIALGSGCFQADPVARDDQEAEGGETNPPVTSDEESADTEPSVPEEDPVDPNSVEYVGEVLVPAAFAEGFGIERVEYAREAICVTDANGERACSTAHFEALLATSTFCSDPDLEPGLQPPLVNAALVADVPIVLASGLVVTRVEYDPCVTGTHQVVVETNIKAFGLLFGYVGTDTFFGPSSTEERDFVAEAQPMRRYVVDGASPGYGFTEIIVDLANQRVQITRDGKTSCHEGNADVNLVRTTECLNGNFGGPPIPALELALLDEFAPGHDQGEATGTAILDFGPCQDSTPMFGIYEDGGSMALESLVYMGVVDGLSCPDL